MDYSPTRPLCIWDSPGKNTDWRGLSFPSPGDRPDLGIEPSSPTLQANSLPAESPGKRFKGEGNFAYTHPVVPVPFVEKTDNAFLRKGMV